MTRDHGTEPVTQPSGAGGRIRDIVDRSIAMYLYRRLAGRWRRPDTPRRVRPAFLSVDEIAYRIGAVEVPSPRSGAWATRPPATPGMTVRQRLVRDTAMTVAGIAVVAVIAVAFWPPPQPRGGVLGVTGEPPQSIELTAPSPSDVVATPTPEPTPTPPPEPTPTP